MKIGVIGTGYVGLVQGVIMANFGSNVICMDVNKERIKELQEGKIPIFEPGLQELLLKNLLEKRIGFTTDIKKVVEESEVMFVAVGTPTDCQQPDRVIIGYESEKAKEIMKKVYDVLLINETPFIFTNLETAEMIKYSSNAMLAVKISFINEIALLAEKVGANTQEIARAMGLDGRISPKFLHCGPGFGGSCFPKDTRAIVDIGKRYGEEMLVIKAAIEANQKQKKRVIEKIISKMNGVEGKIIGVLGLSFKPDTDDMREAPSIDIIRGLVKAGAKIHAYCPEGIKEARWRLADIEKNIIYCADEYSIANDVDGIVLVTEWNQFRGMNLQKVKDRMRNNFYFDLRNVYIKDSNVRKLFKYYPIGQN